MFKNRVLRNVLGPRQRKQQEPGETSVIRSFMSCTPDRYSSNQIKLVIGMALGTHVEDLVQSTNKADGFENVGADGRLL
jgi:hypothetical protein